MAIKFIGDYYEGVCNSEINIYGCTNANLFYYEDCDAIPIMSLQTVCETIGGEWTCDAICDSDTCEEPNAILTCTI